MKHPYQEYETSELWDVVKSSIEDLVENNDIELSTPIEYVDLIQICFTRF